MNAARPVPPPNALKNGTTSRPSGHRSPASYEQEIKELREEAKKRRLALNTYVGPLRDAGYSEEAIKWYLDTMVLIKTNPKEAGDRLGKLAVLNMGEDDFVAWVVDKMGNKLPTGVALSGDDDEDDEDDIPPLPGVANREDNAMDGTTDQYVTKADFENFVGQVKKMLEGSVQQAQAATYEQQVIAETRRLGVDPSSWQARALYDIAANEVEDHDLGKAYELLKQRIVIADTTEEPPVVDDTLPPAPPISGRSAGIADVDSGIEPPKSLAEAAQRTQLLLDESRG